MVDGLTIAGAAELVGRAFSTVKGLADFAKASGKADMMAKVIDLQQIVSDIQVRLSDTISENERLKEENRNLQKLAVIRESIKFVHNAYWMPGGDGKLEGPYSSEHFDSHGTLLRLHFHGAGYWNDRKDNCSLFLIPSAKKDDQPGITIPDAFLAEHVHQTWRG